MCIILNLSGVFEYLIINDSLKMDNEKVQTIIDYTISTIL